MLYAVKAHGPVEALEEVFAVHRRKRSFPATFVRTRLYVTCEQRISPPAAHTVDRAARWTLTPNSRSPTDSEAPVWMPMRDFSGPFLRLQCESCLCSGLDGFPGGNQFIAKIKSLEKSAHAISEINHCRVDQSFVVSKHEMGTADRVASRAPLSPLPRLYRKAWRASLSMSSPLRRLRYAIASSNKLSKATQMTTSEEPGEEVVVWRHVSG